MSLVCLFVSKYLKKIKMLLVTIWVLRVYILLSLAFIYLILDIRCNHILKVASYVCISNKKCTFKIENPSFVEII
jgi:hypothetical protein